MTGEMQVCLLFRSQVERFQTFTRTNRGRKMSNDSERMDSHFSSSSLLAEAKRVVDEEKAGFRRFVRFRLSATVSSRTGETRLYRPTPIV